MILPFVLAASLYSLLAAISYQPDMSFPERLLVSICISLATSVLWSVVVHSSEGSRQVYMNGFIWDSIITLSFVAYPLVTGKLQLTLTHGFGTVLVLAGLYLIK